MKLSNLEYARSLVDELAELEEINGIIPDEIEDFRSSRIGDPFGHCGIVSKVLEEISFQEMQRRMDQWIAGMQQQQAQQ